MKCVHAREYTQIQTVCEWVFGMRGPAGRCGTQRWQKGGCNIMLHLPHLPLHNRKTTQNTKHTKNTKNTKEGRLQHHAAPSPPIPSLLANRQ